MNRGVVAGAAASIPLLLCINDKAFSLARVKDTSMEPSLRDGDILLVRRADFMLSINTGKESSSSRDKQEEIAQVLIQERMMNRRLCGGEAPASTFYRCPPLALTGDIVVYQSPYKALPSDLCVKRVVGLGNQIGKLKENHRNRAVGENVKYHGKMVPANSLWVEGDNQMNSYDSRDEDHGPISKHLMVGIAEYIVWPPSRWQKLLRPNITDDEKRFSWDVQY